MKSIFRIKNWQILIAVIAIPVTNAFAGIYPELSQPMLIVESVLSLGVILLWMLSLWLTAVSFERAPGQLLFKFLFLLCMGYISFSLWGKVFLSDEEKLKLVEIIWPLNLVSMLSLIFCMGFSAKRLVSLETGSNAAIGDYIGIAFLWFFYPFGFWFLQPKLNRIFERFK